MLDPNLAFHADCFCLDRQLLPRLGISVKPFFFPPLAGQENLWGTAPDLRLAAGLNTCLPSSALWLSVLSEVLLCFVKDKEKGSRIWARSKSRAITFLSSLMPSTMHTCCVHCFSLCAYVMPTNAHIGPFCQRKRVATPVMM